MNEALEHVAKRAATWSETANHLKAQLDRVRWQVFLLSVCGALAAAIASQLPGTAQRVFAAIATVLLAASTYLSSRLLRDSDLQAWVRARTAAEALKREAFRYAARARPYDSNNVDQILDAERAKVEDGVADLADRQVAPSGKGSSPHIMLSPQEYRVQRVLHQIEKFYRPKAIGYRKTATRLRQIEFWLALAATVITALAGVIGKTGIPLAGLMFDLAALTAVLTTISGAILAHIEASRYQYLVTSYLATAARLEDANLAFTKASADANAPAWSDFVNRCEDIIAAENNSWVAKWSKSGQAKAGT